MYQNYWGFKEKPFENTPDPRFFYSSLKHEEALMRLLYAISEHKGAVVLLGEYGTGKTLLSRIIATSLLNGNDGHNAAIISNPDVPFAELFKEIIRQLGESISGQLRKSDLIRELNYLLYNTACQRKHTLIMIDEAQTIKDEQTFEALRQLLDFQLNDKFPFTLLLFGQPEIRQKIASFKQLEQCLSLQYHLYNLTLEETSNYIKHRCQVAGTEQKIFSPEACELIALTSNGIPRMINDICDMALMSGFSNQVQEITPEIIRDVVPDIMGVEVLAK